MDWTGRKNKGRQSRMLDHNRHGSVMWALPKAQQAMRGLGRLSYDATVDVILLRLGVGGTETPYQQESLAGQGSGNRQLSLPEGCEDVVIKLTIDGYRSRSTPTRDC